MAVNCKLILYADDSILLVSHKDPKVIENKLSTELQSVNNWLIENKLTCHPGKCETMLFGSKRKIKQISDFSVNFNGTSITSSSNVKYLGSMLDPSLSGHDNVMSIVKKSNGKLKFLYRNQQHLNTSTRKTLSSALIQGHMDYAAVSWYHSLSNPLKHKLQVIQNKMVRFILNMGPREHIGQSELQKLRYLNVKDRITQLSMNLVHDIFYDKSPNYMKTYFTKTRDVHMHNTRGSNLNFVIPKINNVTSGTFYYNACKQWNSLPESLRKTEQKETFKQALKTHLAEKALQQESASVVWH